ncbi:MAG: DUF3592 domain-containing protein [Rhodobacter sp.]|nr:DUF3592 domain-containing protein [Paracoccaceae bacterium]MCC0075852.1 DUF3592 domain-containing protein [Rhodobacter sp.]
MPIILSERAFLLRTRADGTREASWRVWILVFVAPVLFLVAAAFLTFESASFVLRAERTAGTVTRVYAWEGPVYGPVFDYRDASGQTRSASNGMSSANWNFAIGSQHDIYVLPGSNGDVRLANFERLWLLPTVIAGIGLALMIPALIVALMIRRWLRGGAAR